MKNVKKKTRMFLILLAGLGLISSPLLFPREQVRPKTLRTVPKRVVFLIIDFLNIRNLREYKRAKSITRQLIRGGVSHDAFILLTYAEGPGLKYLGGPTTDKDTLIKKVEEMKSGFVFLKPHNGLLNRGRSHFLGCFDKLKYILKALWHGGPIKEK